MMNNNFFDNIGIFYANLTWFYIVSMIVSWIALCVSCWGSFPFKRKQNEISEEENEREDLIQETTEPSLQTQYKLARQKLAEQDLTPEQRSEEKETEAQQLAAILKLLQQQRETFQMASMDELENQLRLYRK